MHLPTQNDVWTSKMSPRPSVFNTFDFEMCFAPQRRALFRHLNFQLPKVLRDRQFLTLFTSKCASRHTTVHFFVISTSKTAPNPSVFNTFYFKCASRQNAVHFFNISTSKSGPTLRCFVPFHFEIGFAPQRSATFHLSSPQMSPHPPL